MNEQTEATVLVVDLAGTHRLLEQMGQGPANRLIGRLLGGIGLVVVGVQATRQRRLQLGVVGHHAALGQQQLALVVAHAELAAATAWIWRHDTPASCSAASTALRQSSVTDLLPTTASPVLPKRCMPTPRTTTSCMGSAFQMRLNFHEVTALSPSWNRGAITSSTRQPTATSLAPSTIWPTTRKPASRSTTPIT